MNDKYLYWRCPFCKDKFFIRRESIRGPCYALNCWVIKSLSYHVVWDVAHCLICVQGCKTKAIACYEPIDATINGGANDFL
jgi:hypothetical protein